MVKINKVDNGFIVEAENEDEDGKVVFEWSDGENRKEDCLAVQKLFNHIQYLVFPYNKHEKYNVSVEIEEDGKIAVSTASIDT